MTLLDFGMQTLSRCCHCCQPSHHHHHHQQADELPLKNNRPLKKVAPGDDNNSDIISSSADFHYELIQRELSFRHITVAESKQRKQTDNKTDKGWNGRQGGQVAETEKESVLLPIINKSAKSELSKRYRALDNESTSTVSWADDRKDSRLVNKVIEMDPTEDRMRATSPSGSTARPRSAHPPLETRRSTGQPNQSMYNSTGPRGGSMSTQANTARRTEFKLAVLGAEKVGKTALVSQFLWGVFIREYNPTVEEFNWIEFDLEDGAELMLQVIDMSGSHDFLAMRHLYSRTADAIMLVFAVDDPRSFEEAQQILEEIRRTNAKKNAPVLLLANKTDMFAKESDWPVSEAAIGRFVSKEKCSYTQVSAKDNETVQCVFRQILQQAAGGLNPENSTLLKKRRQSMPVASNRGRGTGGLDPKDFARIAEIAKKAEKEGKKSQCTIS